MHPKADIAKATSAKVDVGSRPTREPRAWDDAPEPMPDWDPLGQPEPDFDFDQGVAW